MVGVLPDLGRRPHHRPEPRPGGIPARPPALRPAHAALSSWLAAGVPPTEVAARAGNSVKVLLTVYAKCLADQQDTYNDRISGLLDS